MPIDVSGQCIPFTPTEIDAMEIESIGVRDMSHPTESRELGTNTMRRSWKVKWGERYRFIELCLGNCALWDDSGTTRLSRLLPDDLYGRHPDFPEIVATKVESIRGIGKPEEITDDMDPDYNAMPYYPFARVEVFYEHLPFELKDDEDTTSELERYVIPPGLSESGIDSDYTTLPGGFLHYIRETGTTSPHLKPIPQNVGFITPTQQRIIRWVNLPKEAWGPGTTLHQRAFEGDGDDVPFVGTVNKEEIIITGDSGYPMGTMLLEAVKERLYRSPLGIGWRWDLDFHFRYRPMGWNWLRFFEGDAAGTGNGVYFVGKGTTHHYSDTLPDNESIYNARDHNLMFDPD